jgi:hypothetical protein
VHPIFQLLVFVFAVGVSTYAAIRISDFLLGCLFRDGWSGRDQKVDEDNE